MEDSVIMKVPRRYVFLDRDGVINEELGEYTITVEQWKWAEGAFEGLKKLTDAGFGIIVVTNQACVAKGLQTVEGLEKLHRYMLDRVSREGGNILDVYYCPHGYDDGCSCRKPEPGLILRAAEHFGIPLHETFMIGDSLRDMEAGRRAGTRTILINSGMDVDGPQARYEPAFGVPGEFRASNLVEAADIVIRETPVRERGAKI